MSDLVLFDYASLSPDTAKLAKESAIEIKAREKAIWENIIEIGNRLIEVKNALPHGQFERWVKLEFQWSDRTARKYMTVAKELDSFRKDSSVLPNGFEPLYALASALGNADDEIKEEILTAVESKTEVDLKAYIFKIYINGNIYKVFEGNYPKFLLTLDLLRGGYVKTSIE